MGITWIYEDSREAFYSNTEQVPPPGGRATVHFICPFCEKSFPDFHTMQRHASSEHRLQRPVLMWNGYEVGADRKIASPGQFTVANCMNAYVAIDGGVDRPISTDELPALLNEATDVLVKVRLENRPDKKMVSAVSTYRLEFRIADQASLARVEEAFRQHIIHSTPTPDTIRIFLEDPRCAGVAGEYAAGLYAYVHALLLKEGMDDGHFVSGYAMYSERFGEALQKLESFDRKLAGLVCTIVRLMRNDISGDSNAGTGSIGIAYSMLRGPAAPKRMKRHYDPVENERLCPVDHGTSRVIALACRLAAADRWSDILEEECRSSAVGDILPVDDRRKIFAYWAVTALRLGNRKAARYPLNQIANIYPFEEWVAIALAEHGQEIG
ncbi:C2H2-type zinc finger protein [Sinorhizobium meliloti]